VACRVGHRVECRLRRVSAASRAAGAAEPRAAVEDTIRSRATRNPGTVPAAWLPVPDHAEPRNGRRTVTELLICRGARDDEGRSDGSTSATVAAGLVAVRDSFVRAQSGVSISLRGTASSLTRDRSSRADGLARPWVPRAVGPSADTADTVVSPFTIRATPLCSSPLHSLVGRSCGRARSSFDGG
jgi:hypothetical protein